MREIMKAAVDHMYTFLIMKDTDPKGYEALLKIGEMYSAAWDEPKLTKDV
jgi:hypothetical protein